jgi:hypothetical protein
MGLALRFPGGTAKRHRSVPEATKRGRVAKDAVMHRHLTLFSKARLDFFILKEA